MERKPQRRPKYNVNWQEDMEGSKDLYNNRINCSHFVLHNIYAWDGSLGLNGAAFENRRPDDFVQAGVSVR